MSVKWPHGEGSERTEGEQKREWGELVETQDSGNEEECPEINKS